MPSGEKTKATQVTRQLISRLFDQEKKRGKPPTEGQFRVLRELFKSNNISVSPKKIKNLDMLKAARMINDLRDGHVEFVKQILSPVQVDGWPLCRVE